MKRSNFFKKLFLICLMWTCIGMAIAQMPSIKIVDSGMLMSTFGLENNEKAKDQIRTQVGDNLLQEILQYCEESSWPEGIKNLDGRNKNRPLINEYVAYKAATFGENDEYVVLCIPPAKNTFQPANMQAPQNFYFIISQNGVEAGNGEPFIDNDAKQPSQNKETASEDDKIAVKIVNPMELYSNYDLSKDDAAWDLLIESGEITEDDFYVLADLAQEKSWPTGISTYSAREANRAKMKDYKAYMALDYESNDKTHLIMIYIPAEENRFMPENMQPTDERGIFMVFNSNGIEYLNKNQQITKPIPQQNNDFKPSVSISEAKDFSSQLNVLLEGLHNNFADLKGKKIEEDFALGEKNECLMKLAGANETYIYRGLGAAPTIIADFGDYKDKAEAQKQYEALAKAVSATAFPCCTLVENHTENETLSNTYWLPFNLNGKMHPSMENMVMEVQMMKTLGIDSNTFKTYDNYSITLRIYRQ